MTAAWDKLRDWWEFSAARFLYRHRRALIVIAAVLAVLAAIVSTWAYAQPAAEAAPATEYVIVRRELLTEAIEMIERLQADNARLRALCPAGAAAI